MVDESLCFICILFRLGVFYAIARRANLLTQFVIFCYTIQFASAQFLVEVLEINSNNRPVLRCEATGANFGEDIMTFSFGLNAIGCAIRTIPEMACSETQTPKVNITGCTNNFAVVSRGNCSFSEKAYRVQNAAYEALIIYNKQGQAPIPMSGGKYADQIMIPVVMVNYDCMQSIMGNYRAERGYVVTLKASPGYYDLIKYLVPFVAIVGFCFIVLFVSLVIRLCRERRRLARKRLSRSNLKKIPTKKYKKGDREETCAICLEDFQEGEKLRVLPCHHGYHCKCIDPWLTKNRKVCPVCKRKVGPSSNDSSDSDSERASTSVTSSITRENDPLLRHEHPMATSSSAEFPYPHHSVPSITSNSEQNAFNKLAYAIRARFFSHSNLIINTTSINNLNAHDDDNYVNVITSSSNQEHHRDFGNSVTSRFQNLKNRLNNRWLKVLGRNSENNLPHTLLDNEDTSTTVTHDELEFENTRQSDWGTPPDTFVPGSSVSGNSLTTVYSNRQIVTVDVEPTESANQAQNQQFL